MFSKELKEHTAAEHIDLERKMIPYLKKIRSGADYVSFLDFMYGYYQPLDEKLKPFLPRGAKHFPSQNIQQDINKFNSSYKLSEKRAVNLPAINSVATALGVSYVIEGSTLGGQIITKMLAKQMSSDIYDCFSFYNPYGEQTMVEWNNFREKLDEPFDENEKQEIISGANETFRTLNNWISTYDGFKNR